MATASHPLNHLAIIPDGNTRWAKANGRTAYEGYRAGMQQVIDLSRHVRRLGIHTLTFWGLSTENWRHRPAAELSFLVTLFIKTIDDWLEDANRDGVRIIHLGAKDRLPKRLLKRIAEAEAATRENTRYIFNLALDYGGHDELMRATQAMMADVAAGRVTAEELNNPEAYAGYLDTQGQPYPNPDFIVRTSGEVRTSGLMPWQSTYAELYFEPCLFPDFTPDKLDAAIAQYHQRQRRFGGGH